MNEFSNEELRRAAERVREMQRRSVFNNETHSMPPMPDFVRIPKHEKQESNVNYSKRENNNKVKTDCKSRAKPNCNRQNRSLFDIINFGNMEMDNDRILLIGILFLLYGENCDETLMLALLYLLL